MHIKMNSIVSPANIFAITMQRAVIYQAKTTYTFPIFHGKSTSLMRKIRHDINCESKCTKAGCLGRATWQLETHMGIQYQPKAMIFHMILFHLAPC